MGAPWFVVFYEHDVVVVNDRDEWALLPDGVQVVAEMGVPNATCREDGSPVTDRGLWTGDEEYDPFGWGPKKGSLIADEDYWRIWEEACDGDH